MKEEKSKSNSEKKNWFFKKVFFEIGKRNSMIRINYYDRKTTIRRASALQKVESRK